MSVPFIRPPPRLQNAAPRPHVFAQGLADAVDFFAAQVGSRADYELTQALLARFLKLHSALIREEPELRERCAALRAEQRSAWSAVEQLFHEDLALLSFLSHMQS